MVDSEIFDAMAAAVVDFAAGLSEPLRVAFPGLQFEPPEVGPWLEVRFFPNETQEYGVGNSGPSVHRGFLQIAVVDRKGSGLVPSLDLVGAILGAFAKGTEYGPARVYRKPWASSVVQEPDRLMTPVTIPYRAGVG